MSGLDMGTFLLDAVASAKLARDRREWVDLQTRILQITREYPEIAAWCEKSAINQSAELAEQLRVLRELCERNQAPALRGDLQQLRDTYSEVKGQQQRILAQYDALREVVGGAALHKSVTRHLPEILHWCEQQYSEIAQKRNMAEACQTEQKEKFVRLFDAELQKLSELKEHGNALRKAAQQGDALQKRAAVEAEYYALRAEIAGSEPLTRELTEQLQQQLVSDSFTIEAALQDIPTDDRQAKAQADVAALKKELLQRIERLKESAFVSAANLERLERVKCLLRETSEQRTVREAGSKVVREIEKATEYAEEWQEEYRSLLLRREALQTLLQLPPTKAEPRLFDTRKELREAVCLLKRELAALEREAAKAEEKREVAARLRAAMQQLGYVLIGDKESGTSGSAASLYEFDDGAAIQLIQKTDGEVRLRVVGIDRQRHKPSEEEASRIVKQQKHFCDVNKEIFDAFAKQGLRIEDVTQLAASTQLVEIVNANEYQDGYLSDGQTDGQGAQSQRVPVNKAKILRG